MNILDRHPWLDLNGNIVEDIREYVTSRVKKYPLHIGTDTQPHADTTTVVTTICFRDSGKGALVVYQRSNVSPFPTMRDRLFYETMVSLELGDVLYNMCGVRATIHADVNPKKGALSNSTVDAIMGMVRGMGYEVLVKPEAWAADIADMYTR